MSYMESHKHIMLLSNISDEKEINRLMGSSTDLLIRDGKLALCLLVLVREVLKLLHGFARQDRHSELGVVLSVLVARLEQLGRIGQFVAWLLVPDRATYEDPGVVWQTPQCLVQGFVHFLTSSLEEFAATCGGRHYLRPLCVRKWLRIYLRGRAYRP